MKLIIVGLLFSVSFSSQAQYKQLNIGDTVPDVAFKIIRNHSSNSGKLSDFKNKFIILDFWNIYCKSCIEAFPHLQDLQNKFKEDLQIILITDNNSNQVNTRSQTATNLRVNRLPMIL